MTNSRNIPTLGNEAQEILNDAIGAGHTLLIGPDRPDGLVKIFKKVVVANGFDRHRHIMTTSLLSVIKWDRARLQAEREERELVRDWARSVQDPGHDFDEPLDGIAARPNTPEERPEEVETWPQGVEEQSQEVGQQLEGNRGVSENLEDCPHGTASPSAVTFPTQPTTQPTSQDAQNTATTAKKSGKKREHESETTAASKRSKRTAGEKPHLNTWHERWWQEEKRIKKEKKQG